MGDRLERRAHVLNNARTARKHVEDAISSLRAMQGELYEANKLLDSFATPFNIEGIGRAFVVLEDMRDRIDRAMERFGADNAPRTD